MEVIRHLVLAAVLAKRDTNPGKHGRGVLLRSLLSEFFVFFALLIPGCLAGGMKDRDDAQEVGACVAIGVL